jgi:hypothetical protein
MKVDISESGVNLVVDVTLPSLASTASTTTLWSLHRWGEEWLLLPKASVEEVDPLSITEDDMALIVAAAEGAK